MGAGLAFFPLSKKDLTPVTANGEEHISLLTVAKRNADGKRACSYPASKAIANITHGPCRSARYTPSGKSGACSPEDAKGTLSKLKPEEVPRPF